MKVDVKAGQSFFDVAIEHAGDVSEAWTIARAAGCSVTDTPPASVEVARVINPTVVTYFRAEGISPATRVDEQTLKSLQ